MTADITVFALNSHFCRGHSVTRAFDIEVHTVKTVKQESGAIIKLCNPPSTLRLHFPLSVPLNMSQVALCALDVFIHASKYRPCLFYDIILSEVDKTWVCGWHDAASLIRPFRQRRRVDDAVDNSEYWHIPFTVATTLVTCQLDCCRLSRSIL